MRSIARTARVLGLLLPIVDRRLLACWQGLRAGRRSACNWSFAGPSFANEGSHALTEGKCLPSACAGSAIPATCYSGSDRRTIMATLKRLDELAGVGRDFIGLQFKLTPDELMHSIDQLWVLGYCFGVLDAVRQKAQLGDAVEGLSLLAVGF